MKRKKQPIRCPYCRRTICKSDAQRDHVPPQNLFPDPKPKNLITVLCCGECHKNLSCGDEALRSLVALSWGTTDLASNLKTAAARAHKLNPWWYQELHECALNTSKDAGSDPESGNRLRKFVLTGELASALQTTLFRTARGLLFKQNPKFDTSRTEFKLVQCNPLNLGRFLEVSKTLEPLRFKKVLGFGIFGVKWDFAVDNPNCGVIMMTFYGRLNFTIFFSPEGYPFGAI